MSGLIHPVRALSDWNCIVSAFLLSLSLYGGYYSWHGGALKSFIVCGMLLVRCMDGSGLGAVRGSEHSRSDQVIRLDIRIVISVAEPSRVTECPAVLPNTR
jgi:hypothetical protein